MPTISETIKALEIFQRADAGKVWIETGHDILFGPQDRELNLTNEQRIELDKMGWFISDEFQCWIHFT